MKKKINVAIAGIGLLGGSLAKALKKNPDYMISGWARRQETRQWAIESGAFDQVFETFPELLKSADIVVLCVPVSSAIPMLEQCCKYLAPEAIVTDIGSVKLDICQAAEKFPNLRFIGSHPMAGTEKSGCEVSFAELYNNADIFVVPPADADEADIARCRDMWLAAGAARVERISARAHDELVADTSHVLHLLASAMTLSILEAPEPEYQRQHFAGCATGFRDTTRIASSSPAMWRGIMESNAPAVLAALERFEFQYRRFKSAIESGDFDRFEKLFTRGKLLRGAWLGYKKPRPARLALCGIKHCGKSVCGKALAALLAADFIDADDALFDLWHRRNPGTPESSVREIYRRLGETEFRRLEADTLEEISLRNGAQVVALGGGALSNSFVSPETLARLGSVVWIDVPDEVAWERVCAGGLPPFLSSAPDPRAEFARSNQERRKLFERCAALKITPDAGDSPRDTALRILESLEKVC